MTERILQQGLQAVSREWTMAHMEATTSHTTTYSYVAQDVNGSRIQRDGLNWMQLRNHVSNLVCCGYRMWIKDSNGEAVATEEVR